MPYAYQPGPAGPYGMAGPMAATLPGGDPSLMQAAGTGMAVVQQPPADTNLAELLSLLNDSLYPSQREWAVEGLSRYDWHVQPQVVEELLKAAKDDPAPKVRLACIRVLAQIKAVPTSPYVAATLVKIRTEDKDAQVRQEAEKTLAIFAPGLATSTDKPAAKAPARKGK